MAPSSVCNWNIILFAATFKLLTLALADFNAAARNKELGAAGRCTGHEFINGSAWQRNLNVVQSSLVRNVGKTGYNISSHGENGDRVYGLAQCRGDLNASTCRACVDNAVQLSAAVCGNYSSRSVYKMEGCFLRYETYNFYSKLSATLLNLFNCDSIRTNSTDPMSSFMWNFASLLTTAVDNAVASNVGYGTAFDGGNYILAQCWRDLSMDDCRKCLKTAYKNFQNCVQGSTQTVALLQSCMIRYETYKFFGDAVLLPSPPAGGRGPSLPPSPSNGRAPSLPFSPSNGSGSSIPPSRDTKGKRQLGSVMAGVVVAMVLVLVLVVAWKRKVIQRRYKKQPPGHYKPSSELSIAISKSKLNYKFETLQTATKKFDPINKIGQGGFGSVYKGLLDGRQIAVKRLFSNREESVNDFFNEVNLISCVQHKNLVKLLGCSVDGPVKLLVYEYLPNKSLDRFLFDETLENVLDWKRRFDIILGTASGLAYLHQESDIRIIHRDIKASNILLDHLFKPKIADFGLIKYFSEDQSHLSTRIIGTRGYMAPEYLVHGHLTEKVDVYAFGVLVLEIISGRRNQTPMHRNDIPSLLTMVWNYHLSGTIASIIDPNIKENCQREILQIVHIALLCTQTSAILRPSMSEVVTFLISKDQNLPEPTQPPYIDVTHLQSNSNTLNHSRSNINVALNHSNSNTNTNLSPISLINGGTLPNVHSSSHNPMSLNTISISSFGPR